MKLEQLHHCHKLAILNQEFFVYLKKQAVINRLGFNNKGVDHLVKNLKEKKFNGVVGVNIGANKDSKGQKRIDDYLECFKKGI